MSREEGHDGPGARHLTVLNWMTHLMQGKNRVFPELDQLTNLIERGRSNSSDMLDPTIYDFPCECCAFRNNLFIHPPPPHISHYQKSISRQAYANVAHCSQDDVPVSAIQLGTQVVRFASLKSPI